MGGLPQHDINNTEELIALSGNIEKDIAAHNTQMNDEHVILFDKLLEIVADCNGAWGKLLTTDRFKVVVY